MLKSSSPHPCLTSTVGSNKCRVNNGGCSSLCLATPRGRQCACAEDQILGSDSVTCQGRLPWGPSPQWRPPFPKRWVGTWGLRLHSGTSAVMPRAVGDWPGAQGGGCSLHPWEPADK